VYAVSQRHLADQSLQAVMQHPHGHQELPLALAQRTLQPQQSPAAAGAAVSLQVVVKHS
jgi:hypothetical protein